MLFARRLSGREPLYAFGLWAACVGDAHLVGAARQRNVEARAHHRIVGAQRVVGGRPLPVHMRLDGLDREVVGVEGQRVYARGFALKIERGGAGKRFRREVDRKIEIDMGDAHLFIIRVGEWIVRFLGA